MIEHNQLFFENEIKKELKIEKKLNINSPSWVLTDNIYPDSISAKMKQEVWLNEKDKIKIRYYKETFENKENFYLKIKFKKEHILEALRVTCLLMGLLNLYIDKKKFSKLANLYENKNKISNTCCYINKKKIRNIK